MMLRTLRSWTVVLCVSLVASIAGLLVANHLAAAWLTARPDLLMSPDDRINENTRAVRERMISPSQAVRWYDLASADDVKPMWDEFYGAGVRFESYVHFRSRALDGRFYGLTEAGYRKVRETGPWPPVAGNFNVFFFGGSTSFGVGPYWATVASYLQQAMNAAGVVGRPVRVYNFGRSGYQSTQELILFQRLLAAGQVPDMVVFLDGLNDFCFHDGQPSGWPQLAAFFDDTSERYRRQVAGYGIVTHWENLAEFVRTLPLMRLTNALIDRAVGTPVPQYRAPKAEAPPDVPEPPATLQRVIDRYGANMRQAQAVASAYGIVPVFVWQPTPTYGYDLKHHVFNPDRLSCHVNSKVGYPLVRDSAAVQPLGDAFIWAAEMQRDLAEPLYVDAFHYTAPMSKRIAELILATVRERDLLQRASR
jgi:lysophospholipase L1-like esterase